MATIPTGGVYHFEGIEIPGWRATVSVCEGGAAPWLVIDYHAVSADGRRAFSMLDTEAACGICRDERQNATVAIDEWAKTLPKSVAEIHARHVGWMQEYAENAEVNPRNTGKPDAARS